MERQFGQQLARTATGVEQGMGARRVAAEQSTHQSAAMKCSRTRAV
jgi:hypothetical protein